MKPISIGNPVQLLSVKAVRGGQAARRRGETGNEEREERMKKARGQSDTLSTSGLISRTIGTTSRPTVGLDGGQYGLGFAADGGYNPVITSFRVIVLGTSLHTRRPQNLPAT